MRLHTFPFLVAGVLLNLAGLGLLLYDAALGIGILCYGTCNLLFWQNLKHLKRIQQLERGTFLFGGVKEGATEEDLSE